MAFSRNALKRVVTLTFQTRSYSAPAERAIPPSKQKYVPTSGTYPKGFLLGTSHAGVKESNTQYDDIALVISEEPCAAAGVFTRNVFEAAPVTASKKILYDRRKAKKLIRGVVVNSGCANAVTGKTGLENAYDMSKLVDWCCDEQHEVPSTLVMSTGVIGKRLPMDKITAAIPKAHADLDSTHAHWLKAANAICTTDTFPKLLSRTFTLPSHPDTTYSIAGMTKGAGMIHPNMGTLLGIICTDARIDNHSMHSLLADATMLSFNCISVDGDTSTNDTVALLANGAAAPANVAPLGYRYSREKETLFASQDLKRFRGVLKAFMKDLSQLVVRDGEGATKFITIRVRSALPPTSAKRIAESIATSALVKTAMYGKDANWGRILCAIGYTPGVMEDPRETKKSFMRVKPEATSVSFIPTDGSSPLKLLVRGEPQEVDETRAKEILEMEDLEILVDLHDSDKPPMNANNTPRDLTEVKYWTCDFSHEYVTINGDYRT